MERGRHKNGGGGGSTYTISPLKILFSVWYFKKVAFSTFLLRSSNEAFLCLTVLQVFPIYRPSPKSRRVLCVG